MLIARDHIYRIKSHIKKNNSCQKLARWGEGGAGRGSENGYFEQNEHFRIIFFTINMHFLKKKIDFLFLDIVQVPTQ